jgi:sigma-B regulation protein RsbU (phosphoserine phosphatase)
MKVLVADDDPVARRLVERTLEGFGHEVEVCSDGEEAWRRLEERPFDVLISDWLMPGADGVELCRRVRARASGGFVYVLLLTVLYAKEDVVAGILAGADDFMRKPFDPELLRARLHAAERVVRLERDLEHRVEELGRALEEVRTLRGLLPICSYCKRVLRDAETWERIETYLSKHSDLQLTHSICPDCYEKEVRGSFPTGAPNASKAAVDEDAGSSPRGAPPEQGGKA